MGFFGMKAGPVREGGGREWEGMTHGRRIEGSRVGVRSGGVIEEVRVVVVKCGDTREPEGLH